MLPNIACLYIAARNPDVETRKAALREVDERGCSKSDVLSFDIIIIL